MNLTMWAICMTVGALSLLAGMGWVAAIWFLAALFWELSD